MCVTTLGALLGVGIACADVPRGDLLAPADPRIATRWHPPPSPLRGLKRYQPEQARADWGTAPARPATPGDGMPGMKGMAMPGMDMGGGK